MNAELLALQAEIFAAQARVMGMNAENAHREACGVSPAYKEDAFGSEASHLEYLARRVRAEQ